jgi:hypothetical protein
MQRFKADIYSMLSRCLLRCWHAVVVVLKKWLTLIQAKLITSFLLDYNVHFIKGRRNTCDAFLLAVMVWLKPLLYCGCIVLSYLTIDVTFTKKQNQINFTVACTHSPLLRWLLFSLSIA